jgi:hypothetical protein
MPAGRPAGGADANFRVNENSLPGMKKSSAKFKIVTRAHSTTFSSG